MPYFVFRIGPDRKAVFFDVFEKYKEAKKVCHSLRLSESPNDPAAVRMIFAKTQHEAKRLLSERRGPSSALEEWEA